MNTATQIDELHGLLTHLCGQQVALSDGAQLCMMEAFNELAEIHTPVRATRLSPEPPANPLLLALELLDQLIPGSQPLERTLTLTRVKGSVVDALDGPQ